MKLLFPRLSEDEAVDDATFIAKALGNVAKA